MIILFYIYYLTFLLCYIYIFYPYILEFSLIINVSLIYLSILLVFVNSFISSVFEYVDRNYNVIIAYVLLL